jgi:hypothetical protein
MLNYQRVKPDQDLRSAKGPTPSNGTMIFFCCGATVIAAVSVLPFFDVRQYLHISGSTAN